MRITRHENPTPQESHTHERGPDGAIWHTHDGGEVAHAHLTPDGFGGYVLPEHPRFGGPGYDAHGRPTYFYDLVRPKRDPD